MTTYLQQALPIVLIHRTQVIEKKWKLWVRFSLSMENCVKRRFRQRRSLACEIKTENSRYWVFTSLRLCFVFCGKILLRLGRCVRFCCHIILFLRINGRRFPLVSAQIANNFLSKNCNENKREVAHTRWRLKL